MSTYLVVDLLQKLGFVNLQLNVKQTDGKVVRFADAIVEFRQKDPFGAENRDVYIVETKLYIQRNSIYSRHRKVILFMTKEHLKEMLFIKERGEDPCDLIIKP